MHPIEVQLSGGQSTAHVSVAQQQSSDKLLQEVMIMAKKRATKKATRKKNGEKSHA